MSSAEFFQAFVRLRSHTTGEWLAPEALRSKLVADAEAQESNLTDVVIQILADTYRVPCEASGRRTKPNANGEELNLRLPMPLYQAIAAAAATHPRSVQREILDALCKHYGLELGAPAKRRRRRRGTPAAA